MATVLVDDWVLARKRTGVGHYLALVMAHWPADSQVQLVRAHALTARVLGTRHPTAAGFPPVEQLEQVQLAPLAAVANAQLHRAPRSSSMVKRMWNGANGQYLKVRRRTARTNLFFEPNHIPPADLRPAVSTIHDLSVLELPQFHPPQRVADWRRRLERGLQWTSHWICVSQATAEAVRRVLGVSPEQLTVVPLASRWGSPPHTWTPDSVRRQLGLPERYIACLGTLEPRKNAFRLLEAMERLGAAERAATPLIFIGTAGWGDERFWRSLAEHPRAQEALATGYVDDSVAAAIVMGAAAMVYPSLYEGFGLPPLEAMSLGVPVAASTAASLREVCNSSALLLDPEDTDGWADAMMRLSENGSEREEFIERGRRRAELFSWNETAKKHHDLFERLARG
ncbi:MAG: glycosyltransferase family 4 protein [Phycisphaerales bacterium]|nr:glycosyltransferase family 4 protein [Phycisphaerales bacterium]